MTKRIILICTIVICLVFSSCTISPPKASGSETDKEKGEYNSISSNDNGVVEYNSISSDDNVIEFVILSKNGNPITELSTRIENLIDGDVKILSETYEDEIQLITRLLAGDSTFDMYYSSIDTPYSYEIIENGYYLDLSKNDGIIKLFNEMQDYISASMWHKDEIFGFPGFGPQIRVLSYDESTLAEIGFSVDDITSLKSLLELDDEWIKAGNPAGSGINIYIGHFLRVFVKNTLINNFDREKYTIDFSSIDYESIKYYYNEFKNRGLFDTSNAISKARLVWSENDTNYVYSMKDTIPMPDINQNAKAYIDYRIYWYSINPYSDKTDIAFDIFDVMGEIKKSRSKEYFSYSLFAPIYKDVNTYNSDKYNLGETIFSLSQGDLDHISQFYHESDFAISFINIDELITTSMYILNDEISVEEGVQKMQKLMDDISEEYTLNDPNN